MELRIEQIGTGEREEILIRCHEVTDQVREIAAFIKSRQGSLSGTAEQKQYEIAVADLCYIESVDGRTFLYTSNRVYESAYRIYELEEMLKSKHFLRISKAMLVNLSSPLLTDALPPTFVRGRRSSFREAMSRP